MSIDKLYQDEYDFKERNTSFLKRPAAVTIRKPFITNADMSDILTRTLRNYVPPAYMTNFVKPNQSGGLAIRAIAIQYQVYDLNKYDELKRKYPSFKWEKADEEYMRSWNEYSANAAEIQPLVVRFDQNLLVSSANYCPAVSSATYFNTSPQLLGKERFEFVGKKQRNVKSPTYGQIEWTAPFEEILRKHIVVYVLDKTDHDELHPVGTESEHIIETTAERHIKNQSIYIGNEVPTYVSKPKMVEIWHVDKQGKGSSSVIQITEDFIKKAFGHLPRTSIFAYKWCFDIPCGVDAFVINENEMRDLYMNFSVPTFEKRLAELMYCIKNNKHYSKTVKNYSNNIDDRYEKFKRSKTINERLSAAKDLRNWLNSFVVQQGGSYTVTAELTKDDSFVGSIVKSSNKLLDTMIRSWKDPCPQMRLAVIQLNAFINSYGGTIIEGSRMISDKKKMEIYQGGVPFFAYDVDFYEIRKKNREELLAKCVTRNYLTSKGYVKMEEIDFRIRYFMILLLKIRERFDDFYPFIKDKIIQIPTASNLRICELYFSTFGTADYKKTGVDVVGVESIKLMKQTTVKSFAETTLGFPGDVDEVDESKTVAEDFCDRMEQCLFSSLGGFFITSITENYQSVKAPIWNAVPSKEDFAYYNKVENKKTNKTNDTSGYEEMVVGEEKDLTERNQDVLNVLAEAVSKCNNKDLSSATINRVIQGISTANIKLKNDKEKYNFKREDPFYADKRTRICIEPMDQVTIFLPDFEGKVRPVFSGFISQVQASDVGGFHEITIYADCNLKYLQLSRTNVKPSMSRQESENNPLTAFCVPQKMFSSIDNFLPFMFAQALSYIECQPRRMKNKGSGQLFTINPIEVYEYMSVLVNEEVSVKTNAVKKEEGTTSIAVSETENKTTGTTEIKTHVVSTKEKDTVTTEKKTSPATTVQTVSRMQRVGLNTWWRRVTFCDPLFNYLWYKSASRYPTTEAEFIDLNQEELTRDYVKTAVVSVDNTTDKPKIEELGGIQKSSELLKKGMRGTYFVMKQRHKGTLTLLGDDAEDREIAAIIDGTSQPSFVLQGLGLSIQFSNWKTNLEIVNDLADKLNFLCYTANTGVVRFAPYNFDLTLLNTRDYTDSTIDTGAMLLQRSSQTLDADDNPLILKRKYMTSYTKTTDETRIINWLRLSGSWTVGGDISLNQAIVFDPILIKQFGVRAGRNRSVIGIKNADSLRLYGLSWMDRQNKRYRSAVIRGLYDSRMDVNKPYFVQHDDVIYFCESLSISYRAGDTCIYSMGATYGKKPLLNLKHFVDVSPTGADTSFKGNARIVRALELVGQLKKLFTEKNEIKPTVYAQYKRLFSAQTPIAVENSENGTAYETNSGVPDIDKVTRNAAICCYNGFLWDNVSGISFEELVFNYGWFFANALVSGFVTSVSLNDKLNVSVSELLQTSNVYTNSGSTNDISSEESEKERNAFNLFYLDIPRVQDPNKLPDVFDIKSYVFDDLQVPGFVYPNDAQIMIK